MFKTEIWAHKKLNGSLKNNLCEFQENETILTCPKLPCTLFSFLRALRARMFYWRFARFTVGWMCPIWTKLKYELPKSWKGPWIIPANFREIQRNYKEEAQIGKSNSLLSIILTIQAHIPFHQYKNTFSSFLSLSWLIDWFEWPIS